VFDRFHNVGHINKALDQVRRAENKALRADGDDRLVGSKHLWLYGAENLVHSKADVETKLAFAKLRASNLRTARAWALKESLRDLWKQPSRASGERARRDHDVGCQAARARRVVVRAVSRDRRSRGNVEALGDTASRCGRDAAGARAPDARAVCVPRSHELRPLVLEHGADRGGAGDDHELAEVRADQVSKRELRDRFYFLELLLPGSVLHGAKRPENPVGVGWTATSIFNRDWDYAPCGFR